MISPYGCNREVRLQLIVGRQLLGTTCWKKWTNNNQPEHGQGFIYGTVMKGAVMSYLNTSCTVLGFSDYFPQLLIILFFPFPVFFSFSFNHCVLLRRIFSPSLDSETGTLTTLVCAHRLILTVSPLFSSSPSLLPIFFVFLSPAVTHAVCIY